MATVSSLRWRCRRSVVPATLLVLQTCIPGLTLLRPPAALAQVNLRSSFPGRRVGGGSRGLCTSRLVAHLVPATSVFAPGSGRVLGILQGASPDPAPLDLAFRPWSPAASTDAAVSQRLSLPASSAGLTLLKAPPLALPSVWESSYRCGDGAGAGGVADAAAGLDFVAVKAPPAVSLLVADLQPEDGAIQAGLSRLRAACGATVLRSELATSFSLDAQLSQALPEQVPVHCLN